MPNFATRFPWLDSWKPEIDLDTPAGRLIREIVQLVPEGTRITLFGSSPLEISLDPKFHSEDVDCFGPDELKKLVADHGLSDITRKPYVQVCHALNFKTSPRWPNRAHHLPLDDRIVIIPHPIDILIAKLNRMEEKDLKAFKLVREKTGHPTEEEMIRELQEAVDMFRPGFDEENAGDMKVTTRILWREFFGHDIDVLEKIIRPAIQLRKEGYAQDMPVTDYKAALESPENTFSAGSIEPEAPSISTTIFACQTLYIRICYLSRPLTLFYLLLTGSLPIKITHITPF